MCESYTSKALILVAIFTIMLSSVISLMKVGTRKIGVKCSLMPKNRYFLSGTGSLGKKWVKHQTPINKIPLQSVESRDDRSIITEHIEEIERAKLFKADASTYGICAVLATEHLHIGNLKEAEAMALNAIETAGHTKQYDNIYEAYAEGILGEVMYAQGNFKESADHLRKGLKKYEHHTRTSTGPESVMLVAATQLMSWLSLSKNESATSQVYCRTALSMTERLLGSEHPDVANCMVNLATANKMNGDIGKGTEGLLSRALQIFDMDCNKADDNMLHRAEKKKVLHLLSEVYSERYPNSS